MWWIIVIIIFLNVDLQMSLHSWAKPHWVMLCYPLYIVCLDIGKDLGMYIRGVVSVGRFLIMSDFFTR